MNNSLYLFQQQSFGLTSIQKRRMRATKLVVCVVTLFATFWLPIHIINLCLEFNPNIPITVELFHFILFAMTLSYANSCVNPFVYAFLGDGFRKSFRKTFPSLVQRFGICRGSTDQCQLASDLCDNREISISNVYGYVYVQRLVLCKTSR